VRGKGKCARLSFQETASRAGITAVSREKKRGGHLGALDLTLGKSLASLSKKGSVGSRMERRLQQGVGGMQTYGERSLVALLARGWSANSRFREKKSRVRPGRKSLREGMLFVAVKKVLAEGRNAPGVERFTTPGSRLLSEPLPRRRSCYKKKGSGARRKNAKESTLKEWPPEERGGFSVKGKTPIIVLAEGNGFTMIP